MLASVLTVRMGSDRLPGKTMAHIGNKPLAMWIIERLSKLPGKVIVATTTEKEDDRIENLCGILGISCYRGEVEDVVLRVNGAVEKFLPKATFVFRALGDCPFIEVSLVERALSIMEKTESDAFLWHLSPDAWPVYGSREFPISRSAWNRICENATGDQREHTDQYLHDNRDEFKFAFHEPPARVYFRPYRLEVDWQEDLDLMQGIHKGIGMDSTLDSVVRYLDRNPDVARINTERSEKTGPTTTYDYKKRREWFYNMQWEPVILWDDTVMNPPHPNANSVFCESGQCFLGYAVTGRGVKGTLYTKDGDIIEEGYKDCPCGAGKRWNKSVPRSRSL